MSVTIGVLPFLVGTDLQVGPGFSPDLVRDFITRWSLAPSPDRDDQYLTADDIAHEMLPRISASTEEFVICGPIADEVDMAIDWMFTVGGTFIDHSGRFVSNDAGWLELEDPHSFELFVVADAATARDAFATPACPPGIWDIRDSWQSVPVIVRRPVSDWSPELSWNGWRVMLHDDQIVVQVVPDHGFWGVPLREVEPGLTYWAENWAVQDNGGKLTAAHRDGRIVTIEAGADGPVVSRA
ncbi:hypothetical protein [Tsukamurella tyrosinosolvens]|uniref:hypothetical protein n=1 Tax=Tsukamurella tyrosinosolvens TaxID=57704 RepID=UPI000DF70796|nr:hypothetical protein [Tsukamurella tyrosinosolvens]RDB49166.1 hypothetical protein DVB87_04275 [Tsukamurella tyrosinosolvens]